MNKRIIIRTEGSKRVDDRVIPVDFSKSFPSERHLKLIPIMFGVSGFFSLIKPDFSNTIGIKQDLYRL